MPSFQVPVLGFSDGFLSPFPDSLPQLFLRCLPCAFAFGLSPSVPLSFVRFSSGSGYSAFCFFRSFFFPFLPHSGLSGASVLPSGFPNLSPSFPPGFPCFFSGFQYLAFCLFPFVLPSFAPTAVPLVLTFCFRFRSFPDPFCFLSSASLTVLTTQPLRFLFPSSRLPLAVVLSGADLSAFRFACFHASLPALVLSLLFFRSPAYVSPRSGYFVCPGFLSALPAPLSKHLRFRILGLGNVP